MGLSTRAQVGSDLSFLLESGEDGVVARGVYRRFEEVPEGTALRELLGEGPVLPDPASEGEGTPERRGSAYNDIPPAVIVGALPFDPSHEPALIQPLQWSRTSPGQVEGGVRSRPPFDLSQRAEMQVPGADSRAYADLVGRALEAMARSRAAGGEPISKVVLARRLTVRSGRPFDPMTVVQHLRRDPEATVFLVPLPGRRGSDGHDGERFFAGATPELLLEKRGSVVRSVPMAGSAPRSVDPETDRGAAAGLLRSEKDLREHALVVEQVLDTLSPVCRKLSAPPLPEVVSAGSVWHLATRVEGELSRTDLTSLDLARALHPTPAVCGVPTSAARVLISELESFPRDFYAGTVGWCDAAGDGRWMVSIRCAEIQGSTAMLYAGAGVVEDSDPLAEAAETSAKFLALLRALGIREDGTPLSETDG